MPLLSNITPRKGVKISILILFLSIFFHSNIGLNSIIDDYFHDEILKKKVLLIKNFFFAVLLFITIFSLIKLVFG